MKRVLIGRQAKYSNLIGYPKIHFQKLVQSQKMKNAESVWTLTQVFDQKFKPEIRLLEINEDLFFCEESG